MAENQHEEQPITFAEFEPMARFAASPAAWSPSARSYSVDCILHGARGYGLSKDKDLAQRNAIRSCYKTYRQQLWRMATMAILEPEIMAAKKRLVSILRDNGAILSRFNVGWHNNPEYYSRGYGSRRLRRSAWMIQISIDYEIDLRRADGASQKGYAQFMAIPGEIIASLNSSIDKIASRDFAAIRYVAKHELHLSILSKMRRARWDKIPMIPITDAKPGDVLVEEYARYYCQVASISKTGAKIMVHEFWNPYGPTPLVRLKKDQQEKRYKRLTYDEICRWMAYGDRLALVNQVIQDRKNQIA